MANYCLYLNPITGYEPDISHAASVDASSDFTFCAWVKFRSSDEGYFIISKLSDIDGFGYAFGVNSSGILELFLRDSNAVSVSVSGTGNSLTYDEWQHVAFVIDRTGNTGNNAYLYLNGNLCGQRDLSGITGSLSNSNRAYLFSAKEDFFSIFGNYAEGYIDSIRFYQSALGEDEIANIYAFGQYKKYDGSLEEGGTASAVFELDEGSGDTITDSIASLTGNLYPGTYQWVGGGVPFRLTSTLTVYHPMHGFVEGERVYVSFLGGYYYVRNPDHMSFNLSQTPSGALISYNGEEIKPTDYVVSAPADFDWNAYRLDHLNGQTVLFYPFGQNYYESAVVSDGIINVSSGYPPAFSIGIPYQMRVRGMRLDIPSSQTLSGRIKRIHEIKVRLLRSMGGKAGQSVSNSDFLVPISASYYETSRDYPLWISGGFSPDGYSLVVSDEPFPFSIISMNMAFSVEEE